MVPDKVHATAVTLTINPTAVKFAILGVLFVAFVVGAPFLVEFMWNSFISYAFGLPAFTYVNAAATVLLCVSVILMIVSTAVIIKELM